jgi:flagellin-like protein
MHEKVGVSPIVATLILIAVTVVAGASVVAYTAMLGRPTQSQNTILSFTLTDNIDNDYYDLTVVGGADINLGDLRIIITIGGSDRTYVYSGTRWLTAGDKYENRLADAQDLITRDTLYPVRIIHIPSRTILFDANVRAL